MLQKTQLTNIFILTVPCYWSCYLLSTPTGTACQWTETMGAVGTCQSPPDAHQGKGAPLPGTWSFSNYLSHLLPSHNYYITTGNLCLPILLSIFLKQTQAAQPRLTSEGEREKGREEGRQEQRKKGRQEGRKAVHTSSALPELCGTALGSSYSDF